MILDFALIKDLGLFLSDCAGFGTVGFTGFLRLSILLYRCGNFVFIPILVGQFTVLFLVRGLDTMTFHGLVKHRGMYAVFSRQSATGV